MPDAVEVISGAFAVLIIFLGISSPVIVIALVYYLKKRLEHKQIMAAIEKATPLSELRPPKPTGPPWIKNLTAGVALLICSVDFILIPVLCQGDFDDLEDLFGFFIFAAILFALGIGRLIRGLLQRKAEKQSQVLNTKQSNST